MSFSSKWRGLSRKSPKAIAQHAVRRIAERLETSDLDFPLLPSDIADSGALADRPQISAWRAPGKGRVGWLVVPPGAGSGGHTTLFRMMEACRRSGYTNTLLFYDRYKGDRERNVETVRNSWPWLVCDIAEVGDTLGSFDVIVASSWPTAHVAATRRVEGQPVIYFAQDFEPYFYPRGSTYALAEDSYRLGHRLVSLGHMVADCVRRETGEESTVVPFGCDSTTYRMTSTTKQRSGVLFYAKKGNDRRGYRLAVLALTDFHRAHPSEPIHAYGDAVGDLPFPVTNHGNLSPEELNDLYNGVVTGLALSFTNISLVAEEMLAAGVVPVINDSPLARADLGNPHALWAPPTPHGLAAALGAAVTRTDRSKHARIVAESVSTRGWEHTGEQLAEILASVANAE